MGESGVDIKLSPKARKLIPYSIECKNKETFKGIYDIMEQSKHNSKLNLEPIAVIKMNKVEIIKNFIDENPDLFENADKIKFFKGYLTPPED